MLKKAILPVFLFLSLFYGPENPGLGQQASLSINRPVRIEIQAKSTDESNHIIPLDSTGLLLYYKSIETVNDSLTKWYFSLYDKNLKLSWMSSIPVKTGLDVRDFSVEKDTVTFLFLSTDKTKGNTVIEMVIRLNFKTGKFTGNRHTLIGNVTPKKFMVFQGQAFLGYNLKTGPAHMQIIDFQLGKVTDIPLTSPMASTITGFIIDTLNNVLYVTICKTVSKKNVVNDLLKINFTGTIVSETEISTISPLWEIGNLQLLIIDPDDLLVVATYSSAGKSGRTGSISGSSGFFTCRVKNGVQIDIHFKNFLELKNIQNLMQEKDLISFKKKTLRNNRSINDYALEVNLMVHPLIVHNNQVVFMGESYSPEYHPENFTEFDFYGRPYINTYNVFDGYRYSHAIIAGFDKSGNLKWDNTMEIRNIISSDLNPKVNAFYSSSDTMVLCYSSEARIASKIICEDKVIEKLDFSELEQLNPEDKMITDSKNHMVHWYDTFFLCYGYQEIKNINSSGDKKRLVYYFSKVKFN